MHSPAAAALLLAALAALPCQGSDAETTTRILIENHNKDVNGTQPIVNKVYQMLHNTNQTAIKQPNRNSEKDINLSQNNELKCCVMTNKNSARIKKDIMTASIFSDSKKAVTKRSEVPTTSFPFQTADKRRKQSETGSSAPLLNYIFDAYSNTHQHRNNRLGTGNSIYAAAAPEVVALVGSTAYLDCKVDALHDKLVSWVRRKNDGEQMDLITTGTQLYTADDRYSARFIPPDIWRLEVREVRPSDDADYDCQLSAHPPRTARVTLTVPEVSVRVIDGAGADVSEQVCEEGSTVTLRCEVRGLKMEGGPALLWYRRDDLLNDDTTRGGISVRTEFGPNGANSVLRVARVRPDDAGRYTCKVAHAPPVALPPAHVLLHVIKGESLAELHQGATSVFHVDVKILTVTLILRLMF